MAIVIIGILCAALFGLIFSYVFKKKNQKVQSGCSCSAAECAEKCGIDLSIQQCSETKEGGSVKMSSLVPGDEAVVTGYESDNPVYRSKLLTMGLTRGTPLKFVKTAPFGDPVEIHVRGFKLSLRKQEAGVLKLRRI